MIITPQDPKILIRRPAFLKNSFYPSRIARTALTRKLLWKLNKLWEIKTLFPRGEAIKSIMLDFISSKVKRTNLESLTSFWDTFNKNYAESKYGIKFSEGTPGRCIGEVFLEEIYTYLPEFVPAEGEHVVDVGAQFGDYAMLCSIGFHAGKVTLFEPLTNNFKEIVETIRLNGVSNVIPNNMALSDKDGSMEIKISGKMAVKEGGDHVQTIGVSYLDKLIDEPVHLMKIDVEGFEMDVLDGARHTITKYHPKIIIETHSAMLKKQVVEFLSNHGYNLTQEGRMVYSDSEGMDEIQNLYFM